MINVNDALLKILAPVRVLNSETINLVDSLGRVLAEDMYADSDIPGFDNSAMDGYAVKSADIKGTSKNNPKVLKVIENIKAGDIPNKILSNNQAVMIMTGAPIPKGADSIVMVEDTKETNNHVSQNANDMFVEIFKQGKSGENIRRAGEDIKTGELVIQKGTVLRSAHIGILASLGKSPITVTRKPTVALLATGDELVDVHEKVSPGKLRNSNTYTLYTQIIQSGGIPKNLGIAKDDPGQLENKIREGIGCDILLTSGGVSVGAYDLVKDTLSKLGTNIQFWKVAIRPGKPVVFGTIKDKLIFGLPGNPVSSMISFEVFVRPAILKMLGQRQETRKKVDAVLEEDIKKKKGLTYFVRAQTRWDNGVYRTRTTGPQGSAMLKSMARANSMIILPEKDEYIQKGTRVAIQFLD